MASAALSNRLVCCQPPNSSSASAPPSTVPTMLISLLPNMPPESALVVIALFSSQFELENALRGVKLSMDLSVAKGRLRDGQGTARRPSLRHAATSLYPLGRDLSGPRR